VEVHQGDDIAARALYEESLAMAARGGDSKGLIPSCLEALADVAAAQGEFTWAARLLGTAEDLREALGTPLPPVDRAAYERSVGHAEEGMPEGRSFGPGRRCVSRTRGVWAFSSSARRMCRF